MNALGSRGTVIARVSVFFVLVSMAASFARGGIMATQRFDMESFDAVNTEPGWTHMARNITATTTTAGFMPGTSIFNFTAAQIDRNATFPPCPLNVGRDMVIGSSLGNNNGNTSDDPPTIVFRTIVPSGAIDASFTIYRSDPGDTFIANFITKVSFNGGPDVTIDTGDNVNGFFHPPIVSSLVFGQTASPLSTLDFKFFADVPGSSIRVNGIDIAYTPEPTAGITVIIGG